MTQKKANNPSYAIALSDLDRSQLPLAGGKAANLGEIARLDGVSVPEGFCVTTEAYRRVLSENPLIAQLVNQLSLLKAPDTLLVQEVGGRLRQALETTTIPEEVTAQILHMLTDSRFNGPYAIRSSATAEDLPLASFAGQQDSYLNISGQDNILHHIRKCWASLYTDRAISYRIQNGIDHREVSQAVLVQRMIPADVSGVLFTADPVSANRKVITIEAVFGLAEALVSGLARADAYQVVGERVVVKKIAKKEVAILPASTGGTQEQCLKPDGQNRRTLTRKQLVALAKIGRKLEAHFGSPQDIEWCLAAGTLYIVQSRPITTLFPIPQPPCLVATEEKTKPGDSESRAFLSVGHQQMMTDPIRPLGIAIWQLTAARPMYEAGGRLFVDISGQLATSVGRKNLITAMGQHDPLIRDAVETLLERSDFIPLAPDTLNKSGSESQDTMEAPTLNPETAAEAATRIPARIRECEASQAQMQEDIKGKSGEPLFDFIREDIRELQKWLWLPEIMQVITAGIEASRWLNENLREWLGEIQAADVLSQSGSGNITSEMGMALLDVADALRPYPEVLAYLHNSPGTYFMERLTALPGGKESRQAIEGFLKKFGMRCPGEIDITRTRWREKPASLAPLILNHIRHFQRGEGQAGLEQGRLLSVRKEKEWLDQLAQLPDGDRKAREAREKISDLRNFIAYREYPKYAMVNRYFVYKQALLKEGESLVENGTLTNVEDMYYLGMEEFRNAVRFGKADNVLIEKRREAYREYRKLRPPRLITSDGEIIRGIYRRDNLPAAALPGLAVSAGVAEGRARVVQKLEDAHLSPGDILVTTFTDPSWTPVFVGLKGLVTEVGGLMTHGAVIAREYGLPAVVGVEQATQLIRDGQRIRVHGAEGYVEILDEK